MEEDVMVARRHRSVVVVVFDFPNILSLVYTLYSNLFLSTLTLSVRVARASFTPSSTRKQYR